MQRRYEIIAPDADEETIKDWMLKVTREREIDLQDYDNQVATNVVYFDVAPTSSSDLRGTEKAGDIAADTNFLYVVVDNAGTLQWQRVATATF